MTEGSCQFQNSLAPSQESSNLPLTESVCLTWVLLATLEPTELEWEQLILNVILIP